MMRRTFGILCIAALAATAVAGELPKYKIEAGGSVIVVSQQGGKKWSASEGGTTHTVAIGDDNSVTFSEGAKELAKGAIRGDKLVMTLEGNKRAMELRIRDDKIKVALAEGGDPWEIKFREDKIKLVRSEKELGKVKYYADTGKLKAKDANEKTVAEVRGVGRLAAGPVAFLIPDLDAGRRNFILLLLFALGR